MKKPSNTIPFLPEDAFDEPAMLARLSLRVFLSFPETKKWNISPDDWDRLDSSIELKDRAETIAKNLVKELKLATNKMFEAGDKSHKHGPAVTASVWIAILKEVLKGG